MAKSQNQRRILMIESNGAVTVDRIESETDSYRTAANLIDTKPNATIIVAPVGRMMSDVNEALLHLARWHRPGVRYGSD